MAAHARAWHLGDDQERHTFVECIGRLGTANNISTVVLATDIPHFDKVRKGDTHLNKHDSHSG